MSLVNQQPDYGTFPEGDFFNKKKALLERIDSEWNVHLLGEEDYQYLMSKARQFWSLFHYTNELRIELGTDLIEKDIEIASLKRQLGEANG